MIIYLSLEYPKTVVLHGPEEKAEKLFGLTGQFNILPNGTKFGRPIWINTDSGSAASLLVYNGKIDHALHMAQKCVVLYL